MLASGDSQIGSVCLSGSGLLGRMRVTISRGALALVLSMPAVAVSAGLFSDGPSEAWVEGAVAYPESSIPVSPRPFFVSSASPNNFVIDESSITVEPDGVVRYLLLVETQGGARTVTFEGVHCASWRVRIYATGREDGSWSTLRDSQWEPIRNNAYNRMRYALAAEHFCDALAPPRNRDEVLRRLNTKGHGNTS